MLHLALRDIFKTDGALEDEGAEWTIDTSAGSPVRASSSHPVTRHISHVTRHTSHVTPHTIQITRLLRTYYKQRVDAVNVTPLHVSPAILSLDFLCRCVTVCYALRSSLSSNFPYRLLRSTMRRHTSSIHLHLRHL